MGVIYSFAHLLLLLLITDSAAICYTWQDCWISTEPWRSDRCCRYLCINSWNTLQVISFKCLGAERYKSLSLFLCPQSHPLPALDRVLSVTYLIIVSHVSAYCPFSLPSFIQVRYLIKVYPGYTGHKRDIFVFAFTSEDWTRSNAINCSACFSTQACCSIPNQKDSRHNPSIEHAEVTLLSHFLRDNKMKPMVSFSAVT